MGERAKFFLGLIDSSEMACSLKNENIGGCPYNAFTSSGVATLSCLSAALAIVALFAGM